MTRIITTLVIALLVMTAQAHEFLGVKFGDTRMVAKIRLSDYRTNDRTADHILVYGGVKFAGIDFEMARFEFAPCCWQVHFIAPKKLPGEAIGLYDDTSERLARKYGEGQEVLIDGNAVHKWIDGTTEICAMYMTPKEGRDACFMLTYTDTTHSPDDEL